MDDLEEFKLIFFQECDELLADLEGHLESLRDGSRDIERLHAAFRAIHSIKGGAGAFGFDRLVAFAHVFENTLDRMRDGKLTPDQDNIALLIRSADVLTDFVNAARDGVEAAPDHGVTVLAQLTALTGGETPASASPAASEPDAPVADKAVAAPGSDEPAEATFVITFQPTAALLKRAIEPIGLFRGLRELGEVKLSVDRQDLPTLDVMEPGQGYLLWRIELRTAHGRQEIDDVFEFVDADCRLEIERLDGTVLATGPAASATETSDNTPSPGPRVAPEPAASAKEPYGTTSSTKTPTTIRVDLPKIDRLVNMVGELVITQAMLNQQVAEMEGEQHTRLAQGVETLARQTRELQENVMAIRALPVKSVFSRMTRLVRELSSSLGKPARLVITGEQTEVDKTVIEELADPLTHMIRNSMDHGLEKPEVRESNGKPREGTIHLSAEHRGGRIVISVSDDGGGINREKVLQRAIDKGLISDPSRLSNDDIDNIIFLPGFSTAESVSNISGRGVGLDVVKRNIQNLGGRINVSSNPGKGSKITLTLPLTLAVLDGMVVRVGHDNFIIPITGIVEALRPSQKDLVQLLSGNKALALRDEYIPLIRLSDVFNLDFEKLNQQNLVVVVDTEDHGRIGIIVDHLVGQQQVVIKSLEANYERVPGISGATILGNGRVALIIDLDIIPNIIQHGILIQNANAA